MILETLSGITPEILEKTTYISITYLDDSDSEKMDKITFDRGFRDEYNQWYKTTNIGGKKVTYVTKSQMMRTLKGRYDYYNKKYKYFTIQFFDGRNSNYVWVTPRPCEKLCTGIQLLNLSNKVRPKIYKAPVKKNKFVYPEKMF